MLDTHRLVDIPVSPVPTLHLDSQVTQTLELQDILTLVYSHTQVCYLDSKILIDIVAYSLHVYMCTFTRSTSSLFIVIPN